jgi:hypothetical protein
MPYTTRQLIISAYYKSGVVARELQTVSGTQINDGLESLNDTLTEKSVVSQLVPYYTKYSFTAVINQEMYFIPNLIEVETFTFNIGPVRYQMSSVPRRTYFGAGRINDVDSLPFNWHLERCLNGANLFVYFLPSQDFPMEIWGKFSPPKITSLDQDLELTFDDYYIGYLKYALAQRICVDFTMNLPPQALETLRSYEAKFSYISPPDVTLSKLSSLQGGNPMNWGDINIGKGWRPQ